PDRSFFSTTRDGQVIGQGYTGFKEFFCVVRMWSPGGRQSKIGIVPVCVPGPVVSHLPAVECRSPGFINTIVGHQVVGPFTVVIVVGSPARKKTLGMLVVVQFHKLLTTSSAVGILKF